MRITTLDTEKNKEVCVGTFDPKTKIFSRKVGSNHYMVKEKGYGIQSDVLIELAHLDCEKIQLITEAQILEYPLSLVLSKPAKDYGHGKQAFVTVKDAIIVKKHISKPSWLRNG